MRYFDVDDPNIKGRVIAQNHLAFSFLSHMPIVVGHTLICPLRVVPSCEELQLEEWQAILNLKHQVCEALKHAFHAEGFNFAWNQGEGAGQSVPHFHLHVVPRKKGDVGVLQYEPRAFLYRPGSRAVSATEDLHFIAQTIKSQLPPK